VGPGDVHQDAGQEVVGAQRCRGLASTSVSGESRMELGSKVGR
jgi:hypothetical protein